MDPTLYSAYEHGYQAGAAQQPRQAPPEVAQAIPNRSTEWYLGYDDAVGDPPDVQRQMVAWFGRKEGE